jgi:hypothetical protein
MSFEGLSVPSGQDIQKDLANVMAIKCIVGPGVPEPNY